jgi:hypothetical protein
MDGCLYIIAANRCMSILHDHIVMSVRFKMNKICIICGEEFETKSSRRSICYKEHIRKCLICGQEFVVKTWPFDQQICSNKHCKARYVRDLSNSKTKRCEYCGAEFKPNSPRQKYCSGPHYATCQICGAKFELASLVNPPSTCSSECAAKLRERTMVEEYGVDNIMKLDSMKKELRTKNLEKYGVPYIFQSEEFVEKRKQTSLRKYGTQDPMQSDIVKLHHQETIEKRYGCKSALTIPEVRVAQRVYYQDPENAQNSARKRLSSMKEVVASDEKHFDSKYELYVYEFCLRNNLDVQCQIPIEFTYQNKLRHTFIDFMIEGMLFECKGSHLLNGCYDHSNLLVPISEKLEVYRNNNVFIITDVHGKGLVENSKGLKEQEEYHDLIGIDIELFSDPQFPFRVDRPELFYKVKVNNRMSCYDGFNDELTRWKMILNRIEYSGGFIDSRKIVTALNVTKVAKQPSWFSKSLAKRLITEYCTSSVIVDAFAGWGTRHDAAVELGLTYVGIDKNAELVKWHKSLGRNIEIGDAKEFMFDDSCSVLICPPYYDEASNSVIEDYQFETFDEASKTLTQCEWLEIVMRHVPNASEYVMVCKHVDEKYRKYIVEEKVNKSHFGSNTEFVLVVPNSNQFS